MYPDVARAKADPWKHYVLHGKDEGRDNGLHPDVNMFFPAGYLLMYLGVARTKTDPWKHYVLHGIKEGRDNGLHPNEKHFFSEGYLIMYPDVAKTKTDPSSLPKTTFGCTPMWPMPRLTLGNIMF